MHSFIYEIRSGEKLIPFFSAPLRLCVAVVSLRAGGSLCVQPAQSAPVDRSIETPLVEATATNAANRSAAVFQLDVPLAELKPRSYTRLVNVIDDVAARFLFPRVAFLVRQ